jgi:CubicO group peptidase (beta-lactamase class C family)
MNIPKTFFILFLSFLVSCDNSNNPEQTDLNNLYFPPSINDEWETVSPTELNWDEQKLQNLYTYLEQNETRAFMVLHKGKIVAEQYWNTDLQGNPFDQTKQWYWASASKSLTAMIIGIAQEEGHLLIDDKVSDYLGNGWTNMSIDKEDLITIKNQISFTTGIDYNVPDLDCTAAACLDYKEDADNQWYYHNAPYTLVKDVIEQATNQSLNNYLDEVIGNRIGMNGFWLPTPGTDGSTYYSTARDAAKFGLLTLAKGTWEDTPILSDGNYFNAMINSSQDINPSYGYLWWLNGKSSAIFPQSTASVPTSVCPSGPEDMIMALGKNGQFIDIVPSKDLVLIRFGNAPDNALVPVQFHDNMWQQLAEIIPE